MKIKDLKATSKKLIEVETKITQLQKEQATLTSDLHKYIKDTKSYFSVIVNTKYAREINDNEFLSITNDDVSFTDDLRLILVDVDFSMPLEELLNEMED